MKKILIKDNKGKYKLLHLAFLNLIHEVTKHSLYDELELTRDINSHYDAELLLEDDNIILKQDNNIIMESHLSNVNMNYKLIDTLVMIKEHVKIKESVKNE